MIRIRSIFTVILVQFLLFSCAKQEESADDGWRELFNGQDLSGWKAVAGTAEFSVENGEIVGTAVEGSPNTFLITEETFGDFILELELKVEHVSSNSGIMARGQFDPSAREGNGLVYGYQIEADPTERAWSAGVYDEARRGWLYPLDLNPSAKSAFKLGEYNKYRIEVIGDEIKTWLNGQEVAYVVDDMDSKGFVGLQVHSIRNPEDAGRKTYFRNVRIKTENLDPKPFDSDIFVVNNRKNELTDYEITQGWRLLFNGQNAEGWVGAYKESFPDFGWSVSDGVLTIAASDGGESTNAGDIVTEEKFSAFDLGFEFKLTEGANSGVKYFVTLSENNSGSAIGLEYQILDDEKHPDAKMGRDGNRTLASLYDLIKADKQSRFIKPIGEWNKGRIVVHPDNRVEHFLNGVKVVEYVRGSQEYRDLVAISKYKVWENFGEATEGHILLQDHGDEVSFKNIKIKTLN
ncbi:3-keto-disaccharide hydrolase [Algoriphagus formosus]|uniref:3-keto-disaccharide hydrolase n=1 Tax=Algoriphagus formosus TaxID=2007308 RepID=UPI003F6EFB89